MIPLGTSTLIVVRLIGKYSFRFLAQNVVIPYKNTLFPQKSKSQMGDLSDTELRDILTKYLTYFSVSMVTISLLPMLFWNMGIIEESEKFNWMIRD